MFSHFKNKHFLKTFPFITNNYRRMGNMKTRAAIVNPCIYVNHFGTIMDLRTSKIPDSTIFLFPRCLEVSDSSCLIETVETVFHVVDMKDSRQKFEKKRHLQVKRIKSTLLYILINFFICGNDGFPQIALLLISLWKFVEEIPNIIFFKQHKMHFLI